MTIKYTTQEGEEKEIKIENPRNNSIDIEDLEDNFVQVWIRNKVSGLAVTTSASYKTEIDGFMENGAKLKKRTYRID